MDNDDYRDLESEVGFIAPVPPVRQVGRKRGADEPGPSQQAVRMQAWDQQKKRQLEFKWKKSLKAELLKEAANAVNEMLSGEKKPFSVKIETGGAGLIMELHKKGAGTLVARSQAIAPGRVSSKNAERLILEFCKKHGAGIQR